jgi:5-methyltetrahydrofolate--homocysteine methyltransferase
MDLYKMIAGKMEEGDEEEVVSLVTQCLDDNLDPGEIIEKGLIAAMDVIGVKFRNKEMFFPEVMLSATCMHAGMRVLQPYLDASNMAHAGKVIIGTVKEDVHDIGKNLVLMNLNAAGFDVVDLGTDVSAKGFVEAVQKYDPDILGLSALLTTTMPYMGKTIKLIDQAGLRKHRKLKIIVGGAPVDQEFADEIGSDYYGNDAMEAVTICKNIIKLQEKDEQ